MTRYLMAAGVAVALVALFPAIAAADSDQGQIGSYSVVDTVPSPGAMCIYADTWGPLHQVHVPAPTVYARDTTAEVDSGTVGWRIIVKKVAKTTTTVYRSDVQTASATDETAAAFTDLTASFTASGSGRYVTVIKLFWFSPTDKVTGWAKHRVTHYARVDEMGDSIANGRSCPLGFA